MLLRTAKSVALLSNDGYLDAIITSIIVITVVAVSYPVYEATARGRTSCGTRGRARARCETAGARASDNRD